MSGADFSGSKYPFKNHEVEKNPISSLKATTTSIAGQNLTVNEEERRVY